MVKAKTGLQLLKRVGFVLIALPEPFTTPIGVACVITSSYLAKLREASINKHLRETFTRYLSHTKHVDDEVNSKSHVSHKLKDYNRSDDPSVLLQNKGSLAVDTSRLVPIGQSRLDSGETPVLHNLNTDSLNQNHPVTVIAQAKIEKSIHHNLDATSSSRLYKVADANPIEIEKPVHHLLNTESISKRYPIKDVASVEDKISVHHNLNKDAFSNRSSAKDAQPVETEKSIYHNLNTESLSNRYPVKDFAPAEDKKRLQRNLNTKSISTRSAAKDAAPAETEKSTVRHSMDKQKIGLRNLGEESPKTDSNIPDKSGATANRVHHAKHISLSRTDAGNVSAGNGSKLKPTSGTTAPVKHHFIKRSDIETGAPGVEEITQHHPIKRFDSDWIPSHSKKAYENHSITLKQLSQPYGQFTPAK